MPQIACTSIAVESDDLGSMYGGKATHQAPINEGHIHSDRKKNRFLDQEHPWLCKNIRNPFAHSEFPRFDRRIPPVITGLLALALRLIFQDRRSVCLRVPKHGKDKAEAREHGERPK